MKPGVPLCHQPYGPILTRSCDIKLMFLILSVASRFPPLYNRSSIQITVSNFSQNCPSMAPSCQRQCVFWMAIYQTTGFLSGKTTFSGDHWRYKLLYSSFIPDRNQKLADNFCMLKADYHYVVDNLSHLLPGVFALALFGYC